jgi:hypothetical protein
VTEAPRCRVLDIVELDGETADAGSERLCVSSVRRYVDGRYRYGLGGLDDPNDERTGLYDEEQLRPTGMRADLGQFVVPGRFKHRDLVAVSPTYDDPHVAGLTAEVDGWQEPYQELPLLIRVWFAELGEVFLLPEDVLTATGRQAPSAVPDQPSSSVFVNGDGQVVRQVDYVLVDDLSSTCELAGGRFMIQCELPRA